MNFDVERETNHIIKWIKDYFNNQPSAKGAILGISGGKDSTIVAALLVKALGKERVFGVLMPNGVQNDIEDSLKVIDVLGIKDTVANIMEAYDGVLHCIHPIELTNQALTNISPKLRMVVLYAIGSSMGFRVCGTGNLSESYIGYTTKFGDGACDFNPIADYTTEEVVAIGDFLGLPYELVHKIPSDGLCGKTDEDNLGFTYEQVNKVIRFGTCGDSKIDSEIKKRHEYNKHKREMIPKCVRCCPF